MYAIWEDEKKINDVKVPTFCRSVQHVGTDLDVEAGTTGFRGYIPREKSARAYLSIDCGQGDFLFKPVLDGEDRVTGIEIACCGDAALMALADALSFARQAILDQCDCM